MLLHIFNRFLPGNFLEALEFFTGPRHVQVDPRQHVDDINQVPLADDIAAGQDHRPLDNVLEFTHVAGPVMVHQQVHRTW